MKYIPLSAPTGIIRSEPAHLAAVGVELLAG